MCDTALDGVNRVLAVHKEKCSTDYKILKHLKCKGGDPGLLTIKVQTENILLSNADISKHETKLQKEITHKSDKAKDTQKKLDEEQAKTQTGNKPLDEVIEDDEDEKAEEEPMPKSVVQPKYKVVYSYPVEMQDCWEGPGTIEVEMVKNSS